MLTDIDFYSGHGGCVFFKMVLLEPCENWLTKILVDQIIG